MIADLSALYKEFYDLNRNGRKRKKGQKMKATCIKTLKPQKYLRELNLNNSEPGESGVKELSDLLKDPKCKLEKLQ